MGTKHSAILLTTEGEEGSQSFLPRLINPSEIMFSRGITEIHHNVAMFDCHVDISCSSFRQD